MYLGRGVEHEVEHRLACFAAAGPALEVGVPCRVAREGSAGHDELRIEAAVLRDHAQWVALAVRVGAIDQRVQVVVDVVVADLGHRHASRVEQAGVIRTVHVVVAVVVDAVVADLGRAQLACGSGKAVRVGAVHELVAVVVRVVRANLRRPWRDTIAGPVARTLRVRAVHEEVAVVVRAVRAVFLRARALAARIIEAIRILAVEDQIAVVVDSVLAQPHLRDRTTASNRPNARRIVAVDLSVAIVVLAIAAILTRRVRHATAPLRKRARRIETVRHPIAIVVRAVRAIFRQARMNIGVAVVAVDAPAYLVDELVVIQILWCVVTGASDTSIHRAVFAVVAVLIDITGPTVNPMIRWCVRRSIRRVGPRVGPAVRSAITGLAAAAAFAVDAVEVFESEIGSTAGDHEQSAERASDANQKNRVDSGSFHGNPHARTNIVPAPIHKRCPRTF